MKQLPALHPDCVRFLTYLRTIRRYSPHTVRNYQCDLHSLSALLEQSAPADITVAQIRQLTSQLHARNLLPRSIARHLSAWRSFFDWLGESVHMEYNPVTGIKAPRRGKSLPKALSVDEAFRLLDHAAGNNASQTADHAMFELLYSSGLRVSELASLDIHYHHQADYCSLSWIDLSEQMVHITGKGNKTREVPIGSAALTAINTWLTHRPTLLKTDPYPLFLSNRGTRISVRLIQLRLKAYAAQLGIESRVHPHVLRHSFASHLLQSSGDLRAVQELLGHSSIASTQIYTALDFQHLAASYDAAHPRAKRK